MTKKLFTFITVIALFVQLLGPVASPVSSVIPAKACNEPRCGDGHLDPGEECDDGNTRNGDGCDNHCKAECPAGYTHFKIDASNSNLVSGTAPVGNVIDYILIKTGEKCISSGWLSQDDNYSGYDQTQHRCWLPGDNCYQVSGIGNNTVIVTRTSQTSNCQGISHVAFCYKPAPPTCGDGEVNQPGEECELPDTFNNPFCEQTEHQCLGTKLGTRDGYGDCDEECGCTYDPFNYQCVPGACGAECTVNEDCDDQNEWTTDTCNRETCGCEHEEIPHCGDGEVVPPEQCELPGTPDNSYCSQTTWTCLGTKLGTRDEYGDCDAKCGCIDDPFQYQCVPGECGAECASDKDCDDQDEHTIDRCNLDSCGCEHEYVPYCGDGKIDEGEECDDGNKLDGDGCSSTCEEEPLSQITACKWQDNNGYDDEEYDKDEPMSGVTVSLQKCVDIYDISDFQTAFHECTNWEDVESGKTGENGCYTFTDLEPGEYRVKLIEDLPLYDLFSANPVEVSIDKYGKFEPVDFFNYQTCGNGIFQPEFGEECDGEDGVPPHYTCNDNCELEYIPYCGDGKVDEGEKCDDGNNTDNDGCSATCQIEVCGDGILQTLLDEKCDDGNTANGDGCSSTCQIERKGRVLGTATGSSIVTPVLMSFVLTSALYFTDLLRRKDLINRRERICERNINETIKRK